MAKDSLKLNEKIKKLDDKDYKIIELLKEHSNCTSRQIAKKLLIPVTTAHHRARRLKQEGIIKKFTIDVDNKKIGRSFLSIILISCDYKLLRESKKDQHQLAKEIKKLPEVEKAYIVTGGTDIVAEVRTRDVEEFDTFLLKKLQKILGVDRTQSLIVIHEE